MGKLDARLAPGETVRLRARPHPARWVRPAAVLGIGLFALLGAPGPAGMLATVVGAVDLAGRALRTGRMELLVTDRRVLARTGLLRTRSATAASAESVELLEDAFTRRMGCVSLRLAGDDGAPLTLAFVADPPALHRALRRGDHAGAG